MKINHEQVNMDFYPAMHPYPPSQLTPNSTTSYLKYYKHLHSNKSKIVLHNQFHKLV